jgi:3-oxoacyl-(acyl-carrier-protein) synthase
MKRRRVKITGIGPVTPAGIGREEFWKGIQEPISRVRAYTKVGAEFGPLVAAHLDGFSISRYADITAVPKGSSRQTLFAIAAATLAVRDANISLEALRDTNCAVINGSSLMDFGGIVSSVDAIHKLGTRGAKPRGLYTTNTSSTASAICEVFNLRARTLAIGSLLCRYRCDWMRKPTNR